MCSRSAAFLFLSVLFTTLFTSCKKRHTIPAMAFYHWTVASDSYDATEQQRAALQHFKTTHLYIKVMDIDWDEIYGVYPITTVAVSSLANSITDSVAIVPVVFITVRALEKTADKDIAGLAQKIFLKTNQLCGRKLYEMKAGESVITDTSFTYNELQLDCDWTASTQQKYFALLTQVKKLAPQKRITSTLRLHQYRYPKKTGVPPVDELYLMCYNTGEVKNLDEKNSIFDYDKAKAYFKDANKYPEKLNFALPAFSWSIIFKNNRFYKIDNEIDDDFFEDTTVVKQRSSNTWLLVVDTVIHNNFLRKGDIIKQEKISPLAMWQAAHLCSTAINSDSFNVVFYDISHIKPNDYEAVQNAFSTFMY